MRTIRRMEQERYHSVLLAKHSRCGAASGLRHFPGEYIEKIVRYLSDPWIRLDPRTEYEHLHGTEAKDRGRVWRETDDLEYITIKSLIYISIETSEKKFNPMGFPVCIVDLRGYRNSGDEVGLSIAMNNTWIGESCVSICDNGLMSVDRARITSDCTGLLSFDDKSLVRYKNLGIHLPPVLSRIFADTQLRGEIPPLDPTLRLMISDFDADTDELLITPPDIAEEEALKIIESYYESADRLFFHKLIIDRMMLKYIDDIRTGAMSRLYIGKIMEELVDTIILPIVESVMEESSDTRPSSSDYQK